MFQLLIKVIPLDLASALSPMIFGLALLLLARRYNTKLRALSLFLGIFVAGLTISSMGFFLGQDILAGERQTVTSSIADLILGAILIYFGIKQIVAEGRPPARADVENPQASKWFFVGFFSSITNFDAVLLILTAARETGSANIGEISKIIILGLNSLFFALPVGLPLTIYTFLPNVAAKYLSFPEVATNLLDRINKFIIFKYSKYFLFAMFVIFGILLIYRGLMFLI